MPGDDDHLSRSARRSIQEQEAKRRAAAPARAAQPGVTSHSSEADIESRNNNRRSSRDHRSSDDHRGSHRSSHDDEDRESKRRSQHGRSTKVGATSVSGGERDSVSSKRRQDDEQRRSRQHRARHDSSSGATAMAPSRGGGDRESARESKLKAAGLGMDSRSNSRDHDDLGQKGAPVAAGIPVKEDGLEVQAVLVDADEEKQSIQATMAAQNERMQRELAEQNERLRQQMQEEQERFRQEMQQNERAQAEAKKKKQKQRMICIAIVILVLIAGGVGAYFGTQSGSKSSAAVAATTPAPVALATTSTPTVSPIAPEVTSAPTGIPPLHDPPSDEDCQAIANGNDVAGQDSSQVKNFDTTMDMTLKAGTSANNALPILQEQMQQRIMTQMAGCTQDQVERRKLRNRELQANKYVVQNAQITSMEILDEPCDNTNQNCAKVLAKMDFYLQGNERTLNLITRFADLLDGKGKEGFDLARALGLPDSFQSLQVQSIVNSQPTVAPTKSPTKVPTTPPPTRNTPNPTPGPTPNRTPGPTPNPTPGPTPNPTPGSTTRRPTPPPTQPPQCTDFCRGDRACEGFDLNLFEVGCGSCNSEKSCLNAAADIGKESCLGGGCEGVVGVIGDRSCVGRGACRYLIDVEIGNDSCNCDGCCACIEDADTIPPGSCNFIAATRDDIEYRPYQTFQKVDACCMDPSSGGGGGGDAGGGDTGDDFVDGEDDFVDGEDDFLNEDDGFDGLPDDGFDGGGGGGGTYPPPPDGGGGGFGGGGGGGFPPPNF